MEHLHREHVGHTDLYHPPTHVAKHLIAHAIRNIPNKQKLLAKLYPKQQNILGPLKPHEYNSSGKLQMAYY